MKSSRGAFNGEGSALLLEVGGAGFTTSSGVPLLRGISLSLRKGEAVGVLGPNGCGKTTLLRLLAGAIKPSVGTLCYKKKKISKGIIFQDPERNLLPWRTVLDNIALPLELSGKARSVARCQAEIGARRLGLSSLLARFPHQLSGGQKQLVSVARCLVQQPRMLFIDEGFSRLDPLQRRVLGTVVEELVADGACIVFVSHIIWDLAEIVRRAVILVGPPGRIHEEIQFDLTSSIGERAECLDKALTNALENG